MFLVSVVIPTHFRSDRLKKAIESVRNQTWTNLEIIIVSDGYDLATEHLVHEVKQQDERVKFFSYKQSHGGNHARNLGIENSTGQYIAFLDDDDVWYPSKIELQLKLFQKNTKIGLVGCGIQVINKTINKKYTTVFEYKGNQSKKILFQNIIGSTSCVMLKREVLEECGYFDEKMPARQDYDLWIRICQKYEIDCVRSVQLDYYVYENTGKGQQVSKSLDKYIQAHQILMDKYKDLYQHLTPKEYSQLIVCRCNSIAIRAHEVGNSVESRKYAYKAFRENPNVKSLFYCLFSWIPYNMFVKIRAFIK